MNARRGGPQRGAIGAAIDWEVRLRDVSTSVDTSSDTLRAFSAWHDAAPEHAAAWATLQCRLAQMGGRGAPGGSAVAQALRQPSHERRQALRAGFGAAMLALTGVGSWQLAHGLGYDATWRSATGQRGGATLADGTALRFDAASAIDLKHDAGHPQLQVRQGQLLVHANGPLAIAVAGARIDSAGAQLAAGRLGRRGIVAVRGGTATLRLGAATVRLADGGTYTFDAAGPQASPLSFNAASAWTRGLLVADRLPLPDLAEALGRWHPGLLRVTGAARTAAVSGVFRLDDLAGTLRQVARALPVTVERYPFVTVLA